ncbi:MAG: porin family protein [Elusimicrobia bacterium]|nr:porin family protein [Elusimicrobiota bacterium]
MKRIGLLLTGALLSVGVAMPALAGEGGTVAERNFSIGPRAAVFIPKESSANDTWYGGVQLRAMFNRVAGLEGSIDYREDDFGSTKVKTYPVQASLLLYLANKKPFCFFLLGGGGWYNQHIEPDNGPSTTKQRFGPHAGAGIQYFLSDAWSLDSTWRYIWLQRVNLTNSTLLKSNSYDPSGQQVTIGLNYHF